MSVGTRPVEAAPYSRLISYGNVGLLTALNDFVIIVASSLIGDVAYRYMTVGSLDSYGAQLAAAIPQLAIGLSFALLFMLLTAARGLYRTESILSSDKYFTRVVTTWLLVLLTGTALGFMLKVSSSYSRGAIVIFSVLSLLALLASRSLIRGKLGKAIMRGTLSGPRSVIIGDSDELSGVTPRDLLYMFGTREVDRFELPHATETHRERSVIDKAIAAIHASNAQQVLLALPWSDRRRRDVLLSKLSLLPLPVFMLPDRSAQSVLGLAAEYSGHTLIELQRAPLSRMELAAKRTLDIAVAGLALVALLPLMTIVSAAIKLDSDGPIVFRQSRKGFGGREFKICKFRTMTVLEDGSKVAQAKRNDERVTLVGRMLRATSIDELPQLFNVLRGEMSLVGPRPHALAHDDEYAKLIANYAFRHHVKPGITGWAQVNGFRGETAALDLMRKRVEFDLWYINNWSIWLDLWIVACTCFEVVRGRNAY